MDIVKYTNCSRMLVLARIEKRLVKLMQIWLASMSTKVFNMYALMLRLHTLNVSRVMELVIYLNK